MIDDIPTTPELAEFLGNLLNGTRRLMIDWQIGEEDEVLVAPIGSGYSVLLRRVPDFDGQGPDPDHILTVVLDGRELFSFDRRQVTAADLSEYLSENVQHPYRAFVELWDRAVLKAKQISDHLSILNQTLEKRLSESNES